MILGLCFLTTEVTEARYNPVAKDERAQSLRVPDRVRRKETNIAAQRKLRMGMVGGGPGAFIGPVHRIAAELDGRIQLVAGAFSQSAEHSRAAGASYRIDPDRAYANYREMMEAERLRPDPIDFVAIVTPNHLHLPVAAAALESGFPVMSDKPATATYAEALTLQKAVAESGLPYGLTHTYAGYALVREARAILRDGTTGQDSQDCG